MKQAIWFVLGMSLSAGGLAIAAPGDLVYEVQNATVKVSGAQAKAIADSFIAAGAWDGARSDMLSCTVQKRSKRIIATCRGLKTATPAEVAAKATAGAGVRVVGAVE